MGGRVLIFSSLHTSGEQLTQLTGIAALLHFPMPDLEEEVEAQLAKEERERDAFTPRPGDDLVESDEDVVVM